MEIKSKLVLSKLSIRQLYKLNEKINKELDKRPIITISIVVAKKYDKLFLNKKLIDRMNIFTNKYNLLYDLVEISIDNVIDFPMKNLKKYQSGYYQFFNNKFRHSLPLLILYALFGQKLAKINRKYELNIMTVALYRGETYKIIEKDGKETYKIVEGKLNNYNYTKKYIENMFNDAINESRNKGLIVNTITFDDFLKIYMHKNDNYNL